MAPNHTAGVARSPAATLAASERAQGSGRQLRQALQLSTGRRPRTSAAGGISLPYLGFDVGEVIQSIGCASEILVVAAGLVDQQPILAAVEHMNNATNHVWKR